MEKKVKRIKDPTKHQAERLLFIAPSQYGKSYQISNWVMNEIKRGHYTPERIIIISPTHKSDPSQLLLINECVKKFPEFLQQNCFEHIDGNEQVLLDLYETQKMIKDSGQINLLQHYLVIMDDVISENSLTKRRNVLQLIATTGRHYNISTIISLQAYRSSLNSVIRSQVSIICIGRLLSVGEVQDICEQYSQGLSLNPKEAKLKMMELWETGVQENNQHGFLIVNCYVQFGQGRIRLGSFESPYYDISMKKKDKVTY